jgi:hypothetical protein
VVIVRPVGVVVIVVFLDVGVGFLAVGVQIDIVESIDIASSPVEARRPNSGCFYCQQLSTPD